MREVAEFRRAIAVGAGLVEATQGVRRTEHATAYLCQSTVGDHRIEHRPQIDIIDASAVL